MTPNKTFLIGLTGSIASGKSTLSRYVSDKLPVIDADQISRAIYKKGNPGYTPMRKTFKDSSLLDSDQEFDRNALKKLVFSDPHSLIALNQVLHPLIEQAILEQKGAIERSGGRLAVLDAPLLFETNLQRHTDTAVVVSAPRDILFKRLQERDQMELGLAQKILQAQMPVAQKILLADYLIINDGSLKALYTQWDHIYIDIQRRFS